MPLAASFSRKWLGAASSSRVSPSIGCSSGRNPQMHIRLFLGHSRVSAAFSASTTTLLSDHLRQVPASLTSLRPPPARGMPCSSPLH